MSRKQRMQVFNKFHRCLIVAVSSTFALPLGNLEHVVISKEMAYLCKRYLIDIIISFYLVIVILVLGFRPLQARYYSN